MIFELIMIFGRSSVIDHRSAVRNQYFLAAGYAANEIEESRKKNNYLLVN